ncbi:hypothetical protein RB601_006689 [Gaeumannomyces tritici]
MVRPITENNLGLEVLYDGTTQPGAHKPVDIVAVHGMGAHPDDTWCSQVPGQDPPTYVNWLKDKEFLPASVPHARIMRYGYSSQWFGKNATKTKVSDISQAFLFDLDEFREDKNRPLILIGHSFGGLVLLKTLVDANMEPKRWPGTYDSTAGLVFLGTPFRGTHDSLSQGEVLLRAWQLFAAERPVYSENLGILRAGGEPLIDLVDTYLRVARKSPMMPRVACFYEQKASDIARILGKDVGTGIQPVILVDETSGSLDLNDKSDKYALPRTHFDIHRFGSPREQAFRQVRSVIRKMADEGREMVHSQCDENDKPECIQSLCFPNIDARQQDIASAHPGTCDWLFRTDEFRIWQNRTDLPGSQGVLWIKGKPGAGKSTLMKHTWGHCEQAFEKYTRAAYFFNARGVELEKTPYGMLRSLVYQLVTEEPSAFERFLRIFRDKREKHGTQREWRESELKEFLLSEMQHGQPKPLLLLVDALDECSELHVRDVVKYLQDLSDAAATSARILNICLSSRHYPHISMRTCQELVVENSWGHDRDIAAYVRGTLIKPGGELKGALIGKASGVFMWVVLVVAMLNTAYDEGKVEAMHRTLHEVPSDLDDLFQTLLARDKPDKNETVLMLQWVLFSTRPLTAKELFYATLAGTNTESQGTPDPSMITPDDIRRRITNSSRGLIEVRKNRYETVQFIHETVKDFLLRNQRLQKLDPALELNPIGASHCRLRTCCTSYVARAARQPADSTVRRAAIESRYPFIDYAANYFIHHAEAAEEAHVGQVEALLQLTENHAARELIQAHTAFDRSGVQSCSGTAWLLCVAVSEELSKLTKAIILERGGHVGCRHESCDQPLPTALYRANTEVVALLLEKGADVDAPAGYYGTALQAAARVGNVEISTLLLEKGADVNAPGGDYGTALQAAAKAGNTKILAMLLGKGADVNAPGGYYGTALQAAAYGPHTEIVGLLLENGADVNAPAGVYGTALQAAKSGGNDGISALLRKNGARR